MAAHSSVLAWRIPGTGEPGGLPSMGSHRVGHNWSDLAAARISCWSDYFIHSFYVYIVVFRIFETQAVLMVKNPPANAGDIRDADLILGSGRSLGGGHGNPLQYSCLENLLDSEPGRLPSIGSQRVRHDWSDLAQHCTVECTHIHFFYLYLSTSLHFYWTMTPLVWQSTLVNNYIVNICSTYIFNLCFHLQKQPKHS